MDLNQILPFESARYVCTPVKRRKHLCCFWRKYWPSPSSPRNCLPVCHVWGPDPRDRPLRKVVGVLRRTGTYHVGGCKFPWPKKRLWNSIHPGAGGGDSCFGAMLGSFSQIDSVVMSGWNDYLMVSKVVNPGKRLFWNFTGRHQESLDRRDRFGGQGLLVFS